MVGFAWPRWRVHKLCMVRESVEDGTGSDV